jgi:hypothetical protein
VEFSVLWFAGKRSELFYAVLSIQKKERCLFLWSKAVWSSLCYDLLGNEVNFSMQCCLYRKKSDAFSYEVKQCGVLCVKICWETKWTFLCSVVYTEKRAMPFLMKSSSVEFSVLWFAGKRSELFYAVLSIQKKDRCLFLWSKAVWSSLCYDLLGNEVNFSMQCCLYRKKTDAFSYGVKQYVVLCIMITEEVALVS